MKEVIKRKWFDVMITKLLYWDIKCGLQLWVYWHTKLWGFWGQRALLNFSYNFTSWFVPKPLKLFSLKTINSLHNSTIQSNWIIPTCHVQNSGPLWNHTDFLQWPALAFMPQYIQSKHVFFQINKVHKWMGSSFEMTFLQKKEIN